MKNYLNNLGEAVAAGSTRKEWLQPGTWYKHTKQEDISRGGQTHIKCFYILAMTLNVTGKT